MIKWLIKKIIGETKKEIRKSILQSETTRTVAVSSVSTIALCRALCAGLAELGIIPESLVEETALVLSAVLIPLVSRVLAIIKSKL